MADDVTLDRIRQNPERVARLLHECYGALKGCHNQHDWDDAHSETARTWDAVGSFLYPDTIDTGIASARRLPQQVDR